MSDAWRCGGIGRPKRESKRAKAWAVQARSPRGTPATAGFAAAIAHTDSTDQVITHNEDNIALTFGAAGDHIIHELMRKALRGIAYDHDETRVQYRDNRSTN